MKRVAYAFLSATLVLYSIIGTAPPAKATTGNLIANPSVETADTSNQPAGWFFDAWGNNTAVPTYANDGHTGSRSLHVAVSDYSDGDAKWYADPVSVSAESDYTYSDYYKSDTSSEIDAAYTDTNGTTTYAFLGIIPASSDWVEASVKLTPPAGTATVTILHLIAGNGWLQIDDASLTPDSTVPPQDGLIANPSLEISSGGLPSNWIKSNWGNNTAKFSYITTDGHEGTSSAKVTLSNYVSGDAKWYFEPISGLAPGSEYKFSAWYKTNTQPHAVMMYLDAAGNDHYLGLPNPLPASGSNTTWQHYVSSFVVPQNAASLTIFMLISKNGWLQIDDYSIVPYTPTGFNQPLVSLTFDDGWASTYKNGLPLLKKYGFVSTQYLTTSFLGTSGYMTNAQAKAFVTQGSEIGSHTVTHANLTTVSATKLNQELSQSRTRLRNLFGTSVAQTFASPYGEYSSTVINRIKAYYTSHRSTDTGYNSKDNFNPYNILVQNITSSTTPAEVASWVDKAAQDKTWLVIVYHQVDTSGSDYAVTPTDLDAELAHIKDSGVAVKTIGQALNEIKAQMP